MARFAIRNSIDAYSCYDCPFFVDPWLAHASRHRMKLMALVWLSNRNCCRHWCRYYYSRHYMKHLASANRLTSWTRMIGYHLIDPQPSSFTKMKRKFAKNTILLVYKIRRDNKIDYSVFDWTSKPKILRSRTAIIITRYKAKLNYCYYRK